MSAAITTANSDVLLLRELGRCGKQETKIKITGGEINRKDQWALLGIGHLHGELNIQLVLVKVLIMHIQTYIRIEPESIYVYALNCRFYPTCTWKEYNLVY